MRQPSSSAPTPGRKHQPARLSQTRSWSAVRRRRRGPAGHQTGLAAGPHPSSRAGPAAFPATGAADALPWPSLPAPACQKYGRSGSRPRSVWVHWFSTDSGFRRFAHLRCRPLRRARQKAATRTGWRPAPPRSALPASRPRSCRLATAPRPAPGPCLQVRAARQTGGSSTQPSPLNAAICPAFPGPGSDCWPAG